MSSRLVNVRLDPERRRKADVLREQGVTLSDLVREAIDERYATLQQLRSREEAGAIVSRILERYPDPPDLPPRTYDIRDRHQARSAIRRKLTRARR